MKLIVANQKMYLNKEQILQFIKIIKENVTDNIIKKIIICPTCLYISEYVNNGFIVGAQDCSSRSNGAVTGEISAEQLKSMNASYSLVGHSERRINHNESNELIKSKIVRLLEHDIKPILCIGETLDERQNKLTNEILKREIESIYNNLDNDDRSQIIIAYEPIWAIGTGIIPSNSEIFDTINWIKQYVTQNYSINVKVLYGGSVGNKNIMTLNELEIIDGYLIGGASIKSDEFSCIVNLCR